MVRWRGQCGHHPGVGAALSQVKFGGRRMKVVLKEFTSATDKVGRIR